MQNAFFDEALTLLSHWGQKIVIVDVESTGGDLFSDRLTEVALILIENGQYEERSWLINPQKPIPPFVVNLTGIRNEMVAGQPVFAQVASEIQAYLDGAILIAHNAHFDYGFLRAAFLRENISIQNPVLCSVKLSRKLYPEQRKHNLDSIIERMQIELPSRHRALPDAQAILVFLAKSLKILGEAQMQTQMGALLCPKRLPSTLAANVKETAVRLPDDFGFYVLLDCNQAVLACQAGERIYQNCCDALSALTEEALAQVAAIEYQVTVGLLSAQVELALWREARGEQIEKQGVTVVLQADERGWLQANIVPQSSGSETQKYYGYFANPKAAKKALHECIQDFQLCPNALGVTLPTPAAGTPCVQESIGQCLGACVGREEAESHNLRAQKALDTLPVKDWYFANAVCLTETHPISHQSTGFVFDRGRLLRTGQVPFFSASLLPLIKRQVRSNPAIKVYPFDVDNE